MLVRTNNKELAARAGVLTWFSPRSVALAGLSTLVLAALSLLPSQSWAQESAQNNDNGNHGGQKWVASWTTSPQNVFKGSTPQTAALANFAFPPDAADPTLRQANNQTLRMILKPDLWGQTMRIRLTNTWGTQPITFGRVTVGLQSFSGATVAGTNTPVTFNGQRSVTVPTGAEVFSDPIQLRWVSGNNGNGNNRGNGQGNGDSPVVEGRNLAVSMYIPGTSGPMTIHSTALQESFLGAPNSGDHTNDDSDAAYPYETPNWFLVDAVDVLADSDTRVLVVAGSSSADGSITTPGNNDRFLNWMSRRLHAAYGNKISVVNAGIGGDTAATPGPGQIRALLQHLPERFSRDVLGTSGVTDVLFYAGTNDFGDGIPPEQSIASLQNMVAILHSHNINAIGSTLISNIGQAGTSQATYDAHNQINAYILAPGSFDSTADFYTKTADPVTKILLPQYATHSDPTGTPDFLHLGRAGAEAEGDTLDVSFFAPNHHGPH